MMCSQTGTTLGMFLFITMFLPGSQLLNGHALVKVNDPALLTCNKLCSGDVTWKFSKWPVTIPVSECKKGTCVEGPGFENRTRPVQGEPSLHLNPVMYNDMGWYICYCNGSQIGQFHLEVVVPHLKSVCVGASVTIPCYANTDKRILDNDIIVQWEKDGEPVVKLQQGKMSYSPILEGRGFITVSRYKNGDLSLTISKVQESDGGIYRCTHRHEELGQPEAVTLSIRDPSDCEAVKQSTFPRWGTLLVVIAIVAIFCTGGLLLASRYFKGKSTQQKSLQDNTADAEISIVMGYSNGEHSVQIESVELWTED